MSCDSFSGSRGGPRVGDLSSFRAEANKRVELEKQFDELREQFKELKKKIDEEFNT